VFERKARDLGVGGDVIFAGPQSQGIERYYSAADAFALLSEFDTFGMVVLEAMAAGLPVIVSDRMGARDIVTDGVNGFVNSLLSVSVYGLALLAVYCLAYLSLESSDYTVT
jgi:UDP-glucose:(heptosyl)LPS alpha-1,3-glucosyltransferase